jgi:hypothetical protein
MATTPRSRRLLGSAGRPGVTGLAAAAPLSTVDAAGSRLGTAVGIGVVALCALLVIGIPLLGALINRHRRRALAAALAEAANRSRPSRHTPPPSPFRPVPPRPRAAGAPAQPAAMVATGPSPWPGAGPAAAGHPAAPRSAGRPLTAGWRGGQPVAPGWETAPAAEYGSSLPVGAAPVG